MEQRLINEILVFVKKCDNEFSNDVYLPKNAAKATKYLISLGEMKNKTNIVKMLTEKLSSIINQIDAINYHDYKRETILNLVSLSVTDYIINLVKEKHLIDPLLISRFVYIELNKVLYYDISYVKQTNQTDKATLCHASVDLKKEKIFSYVLCTQWLQLYTYILKYFGITVNKMNIPGQDHVWGEINLNDNSIVIVDATDYIDSSIDLSNAKSGSPTVGFVKLPKEYSGIKLYDIFNDKKNFEIAKMIKMYYDDNRNLDIALGYIGKKGYKVECIMEENELFNYPFRVIDNQKDLYKYLNMTVEFFKNLKIPNNMDGYEIFAYYYKFIKRLPLNISANITQKTIYVDSYSYRQGNLRKKFLHAPVEYLKYLDGLIYNRYYKYLLEEESNSILDQIGNFNQQEIRDMILKYEMRIAEINRSLNPYYAINKLQFYEPVSTDTLSIQLYEPMMGSKIFDNEDDYEKFKQNVLVK